MANRKLKNWMAGMGVGLAGLLSNSGCVELSDLNTSENPTEGRQLTVYEGDVQDWTEIDSFMIGSPFGSHPVGGIVTSYENVGNALPPFETRLTCTQNNPGEKDCVIELKDNDIDHYTSGNVWDIQVNAAGLGFPFVHEHLELTYMFGPSPSGVLANGGNHDNGSNGSNGNSGNDNGNSGNNGGMSCNGHMDCGQVGDAYCFEGGVHADYVACGANGKCTENGMAYGQFKEWCANGCEDGSCLPEGNGGNNGSENGNMNMNDNGNSSGNGNMNGNGNSNGNMNGNGNSNGNENLECMIDSDCGTNSESVYCVGDNDIHKDAEIYACVDNMCVDNSTYGQWQEFCQGGCSEGSCVPIYQPTALERLVTANGLFPRPEADGQSDIKLYWAEEQGDSGNFVYGEFPELGPESPVHYEVSTNFMNGKYLVAVGDPDLVGDIGEVIRGTQSTTGMSSAIGGYNPVEAPDFYVFNPENQPIPQEVFSIMAHGE